MARAQKLQQPADGARAKIPVALNVNGVETQLKVAPGRPCSTLCAIISI